MDRVIFTVILYLICSNCILASCDDRIDDNNKEQVAETFYDYNIELDEEGKPAKISCLSEISLIEDLRHEECSIIKVFNQTRVDLMDRQEVKWVAENCACQLSLLILKWMRSYDTLATRQLSDLVQAKTNESLQQEHRYPLCFWSDVDIVSHGVSVYTSTRDYFHQLNHNPSTRLSAHMRQIVAKDKNWSNIVAVCKKISLDRFYLFRYLENLARLDPSVFFRLLFNADFINTVYQASKACKMLLLLKFDKYKLKPDDETIIVANRADGSTEEFKYNIVEDAHDDDTRDIETMVLQAKSLIPDNCHRLSDNSSQVPTCPIEFDKGDSGDKIKLWLTHNATAPNIRSTAAVQCGCELLLYKSIWKTMIKDPDVALMAKAMISYLNSNRVPDVAGSPSWLIHGWFKEVIGNLIKSRKGPLREVMRANRGGSEDPTSPVSKDSGSEALDTLRRGCLVVVLNYDPATRRKGNFRLVQYLDDLESISSDPMFVFQLVLQDFNLFMIYSLSKMCQPIM